MFFLPFWQMAKLPFYLASIAPDAAQVFTQLSSSFRFFNRLLLPLFFNLLLSVLF
jgi:hypothetical protein